MPAVYGFGGIAIFASLSNYVVFPELSCKGSVVWEEEFTEFRSISRRIVRRRIGFRPVAELVIYNHDEAQTERLRSLHTVLNAVNEYTLIPRFVSGMDNLKLENCVLDSDFGYTDIDTLARMQEIELRFTGTELWDRIPFKLANQESLPGITQSGSSLIDVSGNEIVFRS